MNSSWSGAVRLRAYCLIDNYALLRYNLTRDKRWAPARLFSEGETMLSKNQIILLVVLLLLLAILATLMVLRLRVPPAEEPSVEPPAPTDAQETDPAPSPSPSPSASPAVPEPSASPNAARAVRDPVSGADCDASAFEHADSSENSCTRVHTGIYGAAPSESPEAVESPEPSESLSRRNPLSRQRLLSPGIPEPREPPEPSDPQAVGIPRTLGISRAVGSAAHADAAHLLKLKKAPLVHRRAGALALSFTGNSM
jgi:hypothetical protein